MMQEVETFHELRYEFEKMATKIKPIVLTKFGHKCANCNSVDQLQLDHIVALSMGGSNDIDNLQILCKKCNTSKGGRKRKKVIKKPPDSIRLPEKLKNDLKKKANEQKRSLSNLIILILEEWNEKN